MLSMFVDVRTVDIIDQLDWNDPSFAEAVRVLAEASITIQVKRAEAHGVSHVIALPAEHSVKATVTNGDDV